MRSSAATDFLPARSAGRRFRAAAGCRALLAATLIFLCAPSGTRSRAGGGAALARQPDGSERARVLTPGAPAAGDLGGSDSHLFKLDLGRGQYARVAVDKGDLHLSAALLSADGETLSEHVSRGYGPLRFSFVAPGAGVAYLRLRSLEKEAEARHYELTVEEARVATAGDRAAAAASEAFAEAEALRAKWERQSLRAAVAAYSDALGRAAAAGDGPGQLRALRDAGDCHFIMSEYREALAAHTKALALSRRLGDTPGEIDALNDAGYVHVYLGENAEALRHFGRALALLAARPEGRGAEARRRKAQALNNTGEVYYSLSDLRKALDYFGQALAEFQAAGDRAGVALAHLNLGYAHTDLGDLKSASEDYDRALALWQAVGDARGEALTLTAIGGLHSFLGEKQLALEHHGRAMRTLQSLGNYQGEAAAWNGIAQVYEDLNQPRAALSSYERALRLYELIGNRDFAALSRYYVGRTWQALGEPGRALAYYLRSARLSREVGNRLFEAHALRATGTVYESRGEAGRALERYAEALKLYERAGDRRWQAGTLNSIGFIHDTAGDKPRALRYYERALSLSRAVEDRHEEVATLYNMARAESDIGDLDRAIAHASSAVELVEGLRVKVTGEQLRTSYFASAQRLYELYIDLLMQAHRARPGAGFAEAALQASERARARSLLERLEQQKAGQGRGPASDLLAQERTLWQQLDFKLESQTRLLNRQHTEAEAATGAEEVRALTASYQDVLDRIKQQSPVYASLTQARPLRAADISAEVGDGRVLLEYALGERRSYLWAVERGSIRGYELPPRAAIEGSAGRLYELLTARQPVVGESPTEYRRRVEQSEASYPALAAELSRVLLGPVASQIEGRRLLIVCDGALHRIPFDALPNPASADSTPLVLSHEVIVIPSASVLSALRAAKPAGAAPKRLIAVLADPVFNPQDSRVGGTGAAADAGPAPAEEAGLHEALRDLGDQGIEAALPRLNSSLREAETIEALTPGPEHMISTGFDANLKRVTGGELADFRIIHFATHGIFNDDRPELSGLVLSRVDEAGRGRDAFLKADDIYDLHLNADLIVLSACRTGLGRQVSGEGLLGITRGFMYAGSRSVIASLWRVNDEATAELMKHFYASMFRDGLPPPAALRAAKEAVRSRERWRSPYFWAGFVMQGECDHPLVAAADAGGGARLPAALVLPALALAALTAFWSARWRKSRQA
jgi:CHAT domain-containing protein/tetratricopeptide (TPR) repeat protein